MDDEDGMSRVGDRLADGVEEARALADLAKEDGPGIGGQAAPEESAMTDLGPMLEKVRGSRLHSVIAVASLLEDSDRCNHISYQK
jgi:hypothetical protein